jgi:cell wall-associated NlpC family hydrolase
MANPLLKRNEQSAQRPVWTGLSLASCLVMLLVLCWAGQSRSCPRSDESDVGNANQNHLAETSHNNELPVREPLMCLSLPTNSQIPLRNSTVLQSSEREFRRTQYLVNDEHASAQPAMAHEPDDETIARVLEAAENLQGQVWVPYVWGGQKIGSKSECRKCHECVTRKKVKPERRLQRCAACRHCGIDCSHFVAQVFRDADLPLRYATTREWKKLGADELLLKYHLVDLGTNLSLVQPADILLYDGHVVMLVELTGANTGTIIHATRRGKISGGIRINSDVDLARFHGPLRKILRHQNLIDTRSAQRERSSLVM